MGSQTGAACRPEDFKLETLAPHLSMNFKVVDEQTPHGSPRQVIRIFLKYGPRGERVITGIQRVSRPGRRVYFGREHVPNVLGGLGMSILTTSRGVMSGREAVKAGVGGEVLCNVW